jgi:hypothetical protein
MRLSSDTGGLIRMRMRTGDPDQSALAAHTA